MDRCENRGNHFLIVLENALVHLPQRRQDVFHEDGRGGTRRRPCGDGLVLGVENVVSPHVFDEFGLVDSEKWRVEVGKLTEREAPAMSGAGKEDCSVGGRNEQLFLLLTVDDIRLVNREEQKVQS